MTNISASLSSISRIARTSFFHPSLREFSSLNTPVSPLATFLAEQERGLLSTAWINHQQLQLSNADIDSMESRAVRMSCRNGTHTSHTSGYAAGFVQANFVALPKQYAHEFLVFTLRNSRSCPLLAVTNVGDPEFKSIAPGSDVRFDIPRYRVYRHGVLEPDELHSIESLWTGDMVGFLLGCSFSWEAELEASGIAPKNVKMGCNVTMYETDIPNVPSGLFQGNLVVSMRPYQTKYIEEVHRVTSKYPGAHGGALHWGEPRLLGIRPDFKEHADFGDLVPIEKDETPIFWACGVTPQSAIQHAKIPLAITHSPGFMFVTDLRNEELKV